MHSFIYLKDDVQTDKHQINSLKSKSVNIIMFKCTTSEFHVEQFENKPIERISFKSFVNDFLCVFFSLFKSFPVNIELNESSNDILLHYAGFLREFDLIIFGP